MVTLESTRRVLHYLEGYMIAGNSISNVHTFPHIRPIKRRPVPAGRSKSLLNPSFVPSFSLRLLLHCSSFLSLASLSSLLLGHSTYSPFQILHFLPLPFTLSAFIYSIHSLASFHPLHSLPPDIIYLPLAYSSLFLHFPLSTLPLGPRL